MTASLVRGFQGEWQPILHKVWPAKLPEQIQTLESESITFLCASTQMSKADFTQSHTLVAIFPTKRVHRGE